MIKEMIKIGCKKSARPNIIFIVIDSLRARNLGCYGYDKDTSPNIDKIAEEGVVFENVFTSNILTDKSRLSILGGRYTLSKLNYSPILDDDELDYFFNSGGVLLQERLKGMGYKTYCFIALAYDWAKRDFDWYMIGKQRTISKAMMFIGKVPYISDVCRFIYQKLPRKLNNSIRIRGMLKGSKPIDEAIKIINESKKDDNLFLFIELKDTHLPFYSPKEFSSKFKADKDSKNFFEEVSKQNYDKGLINYYKIMFDLRESIADLIARYNNAISYDDHLVGRVVKALKDKVIYDNTILLVFGDHGLSFDENGIHFSHHALYDVSINPPLIIKSKALQHKRINALVQLEDISPTILDLIESKYDPSFFDGKSLMPVMEGKADKVRDFVFMQENYLCFKSAIRNYNYKYIEAKNKEHAFCRRCKKIHGGVMELYDLKKDPCETKNIVDEHKEIATKMSLELSKTIQDIKETNEARIKSVQKIKDIEYGDLINI